MMYEFKLLSKAVHQRFGIDVSLRTRKRDVVDARHAVFVSLRKVASTTAIAECFGMNHSSVVHAAKEHKNRYIQEGDKRPIYLEFYSKVYDFCQEVLSSEGLGYEQDMDVFEELDAQRKMNQKLNETMMSIQAELNTANAEIVRLRKIEETMKDFKSRM